MAGTPVSGSKFSTKASFSSPTVKDRAKFLKKIPMPTIGDIITEEANKENKSLPKPSANIK